MVCVEIPIAPETGLYSKTTLHVASPKQAGCLYTVWFAPQLPTEILHSMNSSSRFGSRRELQNVVEQLRYCRLWRYEAGAGAGPGNNGATVVAIFKTTSTTSNPPFNTIQAGI